MAEALLKVIVISPREVIFEGHAASVRLPGEKGVFEIQPNHKRLMTRLTKGPLGIDGHFLMIRRGVVKVGLNEVSIIVEE